MVKRTKSQGCDKSDKKNIVADKPTQEMNRVVWVMVSKKSYPSRHAATL